MHAELEQLNKSITWSTFVASLRLDHDLVTYGNRLEIKLAFDHEEPGRFIRIDFLAVTELQISHRSPGLFQLCGFQGYDISDRQLDRVNYHFFDSEDQRIDFKCRRFSFEEGTQV